MAEPKYYDELPTYIMHSDGEFKEGLFEAVDGNGHRLTIGVEKSDIDDRLVIESADQVVLTNTFKVNDEPNPSKTGVFSAVIGGKTFAINGDKITIDGDTVETITLEFDDAENYLNFTIPSKDAIVRLIPTNIKNGTGTGSVITGVVNGNNACVASGKNSFAGGNKSKATGAKSFAFGDASTASEENSVALNGGTAEGNTSLACNMATARGMDAFACVTGTASGDESFASGSGEANGANSSAMNNSTIANGQSQTVIGKYNVAQGTEYSIQPTDNAFIIGNGTGINARSNAFAIRWDGAIVLANGTVLTVEQLAKVANLT